MANERLFQVGSILVELIPPKRDEPQEFRAHFSLEGNENLGRSPFEYGPKDLEFLGSAVKKAKQKIAALEAHPYHGTVVHSAPVRSRSRRAVNR